MEKITRLCSALLGCYRYQLAIEGIGILEEFQTSTHYVFALEEQTINWCALDNLRRIAPFGVGVFDFYGNKTLCLFIAKDC